MEGARTTSITDGNFQHPQNQRTIPIQSSSIIPQVTNQPVFKTAKIADSEISRTGNSKTLQYQQPQFHLREPSVRSNGQELGMVRVGDFGTGSHHL